MTEVKLFRDLFEYHPDGFLIERSTGRMTKFWVNQHGYKLMMVGKKKRRVHRIIYAIVFGKLPAELDHADGNPQNNRIENLRAATRSQNNCNRSIRCDNTTGIKGLGFHRSSGRWRGRIKLDGKTFVLQSKDKARVIEWLNKRRPLIHGDFAHA